MAEEYWMQRAVKHPGALRATAEREGALNADGTIKRSWLVAKAHESGTTGRRARLALTFRKYRPRD
jgi:hypothetical protein